MKYDLDWLKNQHLQSAKIKYLFFWGHQARPDGQVSASCLSQWWKSAFEVDQVQYKTSEHWMMAQKASLFGDQEIWQKIIECRTPGEAKKLGRAVKNFDQATWEKQRYDIVKEGNWHKFSQNEALKTFLLNTKERVLVEASPVDRIWGIGLAKEASGVEDPNNWRGLNLLGFAQMEVRDLLKK